MTDKPIRLMIVDATDEDPGIAARLSTIDGIEIIDVVRNRNLAKIQVKTLEPNMLLVDLMLPGYRSIDIIRFVTDTMPNVRILALTPSDPPHDRVMLATEAGALGYICRGTTIDEFEQAIKQVHQGKHWLPIEETFEVLQEGAGELAVTSPERRDR